MIFNMFQSGKNTAARTLYEKIGYKSISTNVGAPALRVDFETGSFVEVQEDTLVMVKQL